MIKRSSYIVTILLLVTIVYQDSIGHVKRKNSELSAVMLIYTPVLMTTTLSSDYSFYRKPENQEVRVPTFVL